MKKIVLSFILFAGTQLFMFSQTVRESRLNILESDRLAWSIEFNFEQKILQEAWDKKCDEIKIKSKPTKGFDLYGAVLVADIHYEPIDLYVKIEKVDKAKSTISIAVSKGTTNFIVHDDAKIVTNINHYLDKFIVFAEQYKLKLDISNQEGLIKDALKAQEKLVDEGKKLQEQIDKNKVEQENKVKEIEALNKGLEEMKLRVKVN